MPASRDETEHHRGILKSPLVISIGEELREREEGLVRGSRVRLFISSIAQYHINLTRLVVSGGIQMSYGVSISSERVTGSINSVNIIRCQPMESRLGRMFRRKRIYKIHNSSQTRCKSSFQDVA